MFKVNIDKRILHFKQPAGTSRGVYTTRDIWLIRIEDLSTGRKGVGECAPLPDLSCDARPDYEDLLLKHCQTLEETEKINTRLLQPYPSILFGFETAMLNLNRDNSLFDTAFSRGEVGIPINGLVWMGNYEDMNRRMEEKIEQGYKCVKLKIGAIEFEKELNLIRNIRKRFSKDVIELRVDTNGAFSIGDAPYMLDILSKYDIHSIEQPIRQNQGNEMSRLCASTPIPIALDEELIGVNIYKMKKEVLDTIKPQYIVLKPSLHGGITGTLDWIQLAEKRNIGSWITSALESSIGLAAIAQLASHAYGNKIEFAQGLGTGALYTDNLPPLTEIRGCDIWMKQVSI